MPVSTLASALHVPLPFLEQIVQERQGISADTALRLSRYFGTTPEFWLNLQLTHDLRRAVIDGWERIAGEIDPLETA